MENGYWCLYCHKFLPQTEDGLIIHDDVYHPPHETYDEESNEQ